MKHGTRSCYVNRKCRCDLCKQAHREYMQEYQRRNPKDPAKQREQNRRHRYGVEPEHWAELSADGCMACGSTSNLVVDHCHKTGEIRGCLCQSCNKALGFLGDDIDGAIERLTAYRQKCGTM